MTDRRLEEALRHFHPPTGFKPWHGGPSALGSLRGVSPEVAAWKPYPDRHSIWELALHVAYWNYAVWRRLTGGEPGGFDRTPSDWPAVPDPPSTEAWAADRGLLRDWHERLRAALESFDPSRLDRPASEDSAVTFADLVTGVVLHDTYHAGQIQLMKRLARSHGLRSP
jgi:uncharacterized damage-inducible protein DinB